MCAGRLDHSLGGTPTDRRTDDDTHAHSSVPAAADPSSPAHCPTHRRLADGGHRGARGQRQDRTMHLFSRATSSTFVDAQGHPVAPNRPPAVGDTFDNTGLDYVGNHNRHAAKPNGSDHLRCTITSVT